MADFLSLPCIEFEERFTGKSVDAGRTNHTEEVEAEQNIASNRVCEQCSPIKSSLPNTSIFSLSIHHLPLHENLIQCPMTSIVALRWLL